tara:strand:+ start:2575 stop:3114 length:540 start_codon:yes stop_codon:yes gene_type:complete
MKTTIAIILMFVLSACSTTGNINKDVQVNDVLLRGGSEVPKWFFDYPKDTDENVYAVATGQSDDMQFAIDKAMHDAKVTVADKLQNYINGDFKRIITDSGSVINGNTSQKTTKITQSIIDELPLGGYVVENKIVLNESNGYRAFVLITFDVSDWTPPVKITQVDQNALDQEFAGSEVIQ